MPKTTDRWDIYDDTLPFAGAKYGPQRARMAAIGIGDGGLLIVSPGVPMSDAAWHELANLGAPRFLLAPNHFHNAGLAAWQARFPAATIVAHPRAQARLRKKLPGLSSPTSPRSSPPCRTTSACSARRWRSKARPGSRSQPSTASRGSSPTPSSTRSAYPAPWACSCA
ncbi:hypothetical protein [Nannocystis sp.]|uniref:hypothetical protein n=1 Tax=Nannocystis sp. TaxID=1962667 RepID=UPI0025DC91DA|nr:hypothetical protein [Nannocystis sp.]MBK7829525.1 hypothetical protein [Nannocystis sp.]